MRRTSNTVSVPIALGPTPSVARGKRAQDARADYGGQPGHGGDAIDRPQRVLVVDGDPDSRTALPAPCNAPVTQPSRWARVKRRWRRPTGSAPRS